MESELLFGEFRRSFDDRFRVGIPAELLEPLNLQAGQAILAKERPGCLSLWNATVWHQQMDADVRVLQGKVQAGRLEGRLNEVQQIGRLLSTRHRDVKVSERGRLLIPEGFREFLQIEPGEESMIVGAAVCVEVWRPAAWLDYLNRRMPRFRKLFDGLVD
ncbi:MAG: division/cell wall cluster transcriptional repressor MraZ [Pirellulales bacterium]|nr:division/cell wall cluster transcriptional repressor MraZ [Pirellulales bacterium]